MDGQVTTGLLSQATGLELAPAWLSCDAIGRGDLSLWESRGAHFLCQPLSVGPDSGTLLCLESPPDPLLLPRQHLAQVALLCVSASSLCPAQTLEVLLLRHLSLWAVRFRLPDCSLHWLSLP